MSGAGSQRVVHPRVVKEVHLRKEDYLFSGATASEDEKSSRAAWPGVVGLVSVLCICEAISAVLTVWARSICGVVSLATLDLSLSALASVPLRKSAPVTLVRALCLAVYSAASAFAAKPSFQSFDVDAIDSGLKELQQALTYALFGGDPPVAEVTFPRREKNNTDVSTAAKAKMVLLWAALEPLGAAASAPKQSLKGTLSALVVAVFLFVLGDSFFSETDENENDDLSTTGERSLGAARLGLLAAAAVAAGASTQLWTRRPSQRQMEGQRHHSSRRRSTAALSLLAAALALPFALLVDGFPRHLTTPKLLLDRALLLAYAFSCFLKRELRARCSTLFPDASNAAMLGALRGILLILACYAARYYPIL